VTRLQALNPQTHERLALEREPLRTKRRTTMLLTKSYQKTSPRASAFLKNLGAEIDVLVALFNRCNPSIESFHSGDRYVTAVCGDGGYVFAEADDDERTRHDLITAALEFVRKCAAAA